MNVQCRKARPWYRRMASKDEDSSCSTIETPSSTSFESPDVPTSLLRNTQVTNICRLQEKLQGSSNEDATQLDKVRNFTHFIREVQEIQNKFNIHIQEAYKLHAKQWKKAITILRSMWIHTITENSQEYRAGIYEYFSCFAQPDLTINEGQKPNVFDSVWMRNKRDYFEGTSLLKLNEEFDVFLAYIDNEIREISTSFHQECVQFQTQISELGNYTGNVADFRCAYFEKLLSWSLNYDASYHDRMKRLTMSFFQGMFNASTNFKMQLKEADRQYVADLQRTCSEIVSIDPLSATLLLRILKEEEITYDDHLRVRLEDIKINQSKEFNKTVSELIKNREMIFSIMKNEFNNLLSTN